MKKSGGTVSVREYKYKLSICVATMNRAGQLTEALESCLACALPEKTEFVIIDNASTDETADAVRQTLNDSGYDYYYEKLPQNIGAGKGRCFYYTKAQGAYVFGFDDDALIDCQHCPDFFMRAIELLDENTDISILATQVYDRAWKANRQEIYGKQRSNGLYACYMFCGGSHFLRKSFFGDVPPYLSNSYGYEELPPSLIAADHRGIALCADLTVIHNPKQNKWDYTKKENVEILIMYCAAPYAIKQMMYPVVAHGLLKALYCVRKRKYLASAADRKRADLMVKEIRDKCRIKYRIRLKTLLALVADFGKTAL